MRSIGIKCGLVTLCVVLLVGAAQAKEIDWKGMQHDLDIMEAVLGKIL